MVFKRSVTLAAWAACILLPVTGHALTVSPSDCDEGGDFIRNAALSRDSGISSRDFLGRLEGDLIAIRAIPKELRWFAQDNDDEQMLRTAAEAVFAAPRDPDDHGREFRAQCRVAVASAASPAGKVSALERPSP